MSDFIEQIARPLGENLAGDDPRYSDNFYAARQEIEKLTDVKYQTVYERCRNILLNEAKDLRVAGYYAVAALHEHGIDGLIEALQVYQLLLKNFWQQVHPQRAEARLQTIRWLNNERILLFVQQNADCSEDQIKLLATTVAELNSTIKNYAGPEASSFNLLNDWLTIAQQRQIQPAVTQNVDQINNQSAVQDVVQEINSASKADENCGKIINYYQQQEAYLPAAAFARALRWGDMRLPPHENNKTKIPAPRAEGLNQLHKLLSADNHKEIYLYCEGLFLEPGGHVLLDLQYYAYMSVKEFSDDLALFLEAEVAALLRRIPLLSDLQFNDGTPFANSETKNWLNSLVMDSTNGVSIVDNSFDVKKVITKAKQQAKGKKLKDYLAYLNQLPTSLMQEKFINQYAMAKLCLENKRADIALPILEKLSQQIEKHDLTNWQPDLAISVLSDLYVALQARLKKSIDPVKQQLMHRIDAIYSQLCQINPEFGVNL